MSLRLPENLSRALDGLADAADRPKSYLVLKAIEAYLAEHADYQVALDRLRDKDDRIISGAELRNSLASKF